MELPISRSVVSSLKGRLFGKQQQQLEDAPQVNATCVMKSKERSIKRILGYPQNNLLVSFHDMRVIRIWDILAGECLHSIDTNHSKISTVQGDLMFVASTDDSLNVVKVYDLKTYDLVGVLSGHTSWISRIMVEENQVITASNDGTARVYDLSILSQSHALGECIYVPCSLVMSKQASAIASITTHENYLITGGSDGEILLWNLKSEDNQTTAGNTEAEVKADKVFESGHKKVIFGLKIYKNFLYSASLDQSIRVWNIQTGKCAQHFDLEDLIPDFRVDFRNMIEDTIFPVSSQDFQIHQFSLKTGKIVRTFSGHTGEVRALCLSESSEFLYSGSADRTIRKWDLKTGSCVSVLRGHIEEVNTLCMLAGYLYSGAEDGTVREWPNVEEHSEIFQRVQRSHTSQIDLSYSKLSSLPNFLVKLPKIDVLYLNYNHLARLPTDICQLTNLKALNLDHNYFTQFPNALGLLPNLRQLYLEHNNLTHISRVALENLTNLEMLYLGNNNITELPPNLCGLTNLQRLCISNNRIQSLPPIGTLTDLKVLKLDNNQLKTLPANMANLVKLTSLSLNNNPLEIPAECLVSVEAVLYFLTYNAKPEPNAEVDLDEVTSTESRLSHHSKPNGDTTRRPPSESFRKKLPPIPPKRPHQEKAPPQQLIRKSGGPNFYVPELGKTRDDSYLNMTSPDVSRDRKNQPGMRDSMAFSKKPLPNLPSNNNNNNNSFIQPKLSPVKPLPPPPKMRTITLGAVPLTKSSSAPASATASPRTSPLPFSPPSPTNTPSVPNFSNQVSATGLNKPLPSKAKPLPPKPPLKPSGMSLSSEDLLHSSRKLSVESAEAVRKYSSASEEEQSLSAPTSRRPSVETSPTTDVPKAPKLFKNHTALGLMTDSSSKAPPVPVKPLPPPPKMRAITFAAIPAPNPQAQQQIHAQQQQQPSKLPASSSADSPRRLSRTNSDKAVSKNSFIKDRKSATIDTDCLDSLKQELHAKEHPEVVDVEIKHGTLTEHVDITIPTERTKFETNLLYEKVELSDIKQKINKKLQLDGEDSFNLMFWDSIETEWKWLEANSIRHFFTCEHRTLFVLLEST